MNRKIKALLVERGITQKEIAEALGILPATVCGVINGHHAGERTKKYIAKRLGVSYEKLWGE